VVSGVWPLPPEMADPTEMNRLKLSQSQLEDMIGQLREQMQETRDLLAVA